MFVTTIFVSILFTIFLKYFKREYKNDFPVYPGALPVIGNALSLLGDNVHLFKTLKNASDKLIENEGYLVLQLGPFKRFYVLGDPDDCATALRVCLQKHYAYSFSKAWIGEGLVTADVPTWKKNRKFLHPMFGQKHINKFLPVFNKQARRLVSRLAQQEGKGAFNPELHVLLATLETVCQTALGIDIEEDLAEHKEYVDAIENIMDVITTRFKKVWLHRDCIFYWSSLKRRQDECLKVINKMSYDLLQKRKSELNSCVTNMDESKDFHPFVDTVIKVAAENDCFTDQKINHELNTLIISGYDTTANAIIYCLMLLGHHQDVQKKVYEELKEVFSDTERDVEKDDFVNLVYLEAVIKETLRIFPVIPLVGRYTNEELKLKKHTIPPGSEFFVSNYSINRHPMWGPDAEVFRPGRWLDGTAPTDPNLFASFGLGKRYCIGKTYNLISFKTTMSHLIRRFHVTADISKLVLKMEILLKPASGHDIILEPRISS